MRWTLFALLTLLTHGLASSTWAASTAEQGRWSGYASMEVRLFPETPLWDGQRTFYPAFAFQPEYYQEWSGGKESFTMVPFLRVAGVDDQRTHVDFRELTWQMARQDWELRLGARKVYWGVTESRHLVDILNQSDLVEGLDGKKKMGQPMVNLALPSSWGTMDLFWLPYFRERTFPGKGGRLRDGRVVDTQQAEYESSAKEWHQDGALRWRTNYGPWDLGLSHFDGTSRDPLFKPGRTSGSETIWKPYYQQITQSGLDLQATLGAWLWKLETISREGNNERYTAATGGFEYTLNGLFDSSADLGVIGEYLFDDRHRAAPHPFQDDLMTGLRLTMNDSASSELLLATLVDPGSGTWGWTLEASRRLAAEWKLSLESRLFAETPANDPSFSQRRDHSLQLELARYF